MTNLLKLQFCNEYVKTSKLDSFFEVYETIIINCNTDKYSKRDYICMP